MNAIQSAVDQLGQALTDADRFNNGIIEGDRVQYAMRILMKTDEYKKERL